MKHLFTRTTRWWSLTALLCFLTFQTSLYAQDKQEFTKGVIRIKIKPSDVQFLEQQVAKITENELPLNSTGFRNFDQLNDKFQAKRINRVFRDAGKFEARHRAYGFHQWYEIETDSLNEVQELVAAYSALDMVEFAEPRSTHNILAEALNPPNDPFFRNQWHYDNFGQDYGTPGADINLLKAWEIETGKPDVVVGVIDGGIDVNHPDLKNRLWINTGEIPGNGIDDDGNGYVDDYYGWNYADNMPTIIPHEHGTHVAGTIAAENNNGIGVSGVAGGSKPEDGVRMMSLQVFSDYLGAPTYGGFEEAFIYAADMGAVITNNSWGSGGESELQKATIRYFVENGGKDKEGNYTGPVQGGVVIFAAGNYGAITNVYTRPATSYPSNMEEVVSVANTDNNDKKAISSYWNETIDIAAPGSNIYSTFPDGRYEAISGTSMAAPHVAGVAALIASNNAYNITADQVKDRLINHSKNIDHLNPTFVGKIGKGRLDAYASLVKDEGALPPVVSDWGFQYVYSTSTRIGWSFVKDDFGLTIKKYEILLAQGTFEDNEAFENAAEKISYHAITGNSFANYEIDHLSPVSTYSIAIKAVDNFGNKSPLSEVFEISTQATPLLSWVSDEEPHLTYDVTSAELPKTNIAIVNNGSVPSRIVFTINDFEHNTVESNPVGRTAAASVDTNLPFSTSEEYAKIPFSEIPDEGTTPDLEEVITILSDSKKIDSVYHDEQEVPTFMVGHSGAAMEYANKFVAERDMEIGMVSAVLSNEMYLSVPFTVAMYIGGEDQPFGQPVATSSLYVSDQQRGGWVSTSFWPKTVKAGETFWIAIGAPQGIFYPLGADEASYSDRGISYARKGTHGYYTDYAAAHGSLFKIRAYEIQKKNDLVSFSDRYADIENGEIASTDVTLKKGDWKNGTYKLQILGQHENPMQYPLAKNIYVTVTGNTAELTCDVEELAFGTLFENQSENTKFIIKNEGKAELENIQLSVTEDDFFEVSPSEIAELKPGAQVEITVSAKGSDQVIDVQSELSITGLAETIPLSVNHIIGPKVESDQPTVSWIDDDAVTIGETATAEFTLTNNGDQATEFVFDAIENDGYTSFVSDITPSRATLDIGESVTLQVSVDTEGEIAYSDKKSVTLYATHDGGKTAVKFEVELHGDVIAEYDADVDFGSVIYKEGITLSKTVTISNKGNVKGTFALGELPAGFTVSGYIPSSVSPNGKVNLNIKAEFAAIGELMGVLPFTMNDETFEINLSASALPSPTVDVNTTEFITSNTIAYGEDGESTSFTINNESEDLDLHYSLSTPKWMTQAGDEFFDYDGTDNGFGYEYKMYDELIWEDISEVGKDVSYEMFYPEFVYAYEFENFEFPFYGQYYDRFQMSIAALISFNPETEAYDFTYTPYPAYNIATGSIYNGLDLGIISAFWMKMVPSSLEGSGIFMYEKEDRLIIQFEKNVAAGAGSLGNETITSIQIVLHKNGDIDMAYKTLPNVFVYQNIGMKNIEGDYAFQYMETNADFRKELLGKTLRIKAPKIITVPAKSSEVVNLQYVGNNTPVGEHNGEVIVHNNDASNPRITTDVTLTITGEADLSIEESDLEFTQLVYLEDTAFEETKTFVVKNEGSLPVNVTASLMNDESFHFDIDTLLGAFDALTLEVSYAALTNEEVSDVLILDFDNGDQLELPLKGNAVLPAVLDYDLGTSMRVDTLDLLVNEGQETVHEFVVSNNGDEQVLDYALTLGIAKYGWGVEKSMRTKATSETQFPEEATLIDHNTVESFKMLNTYEFAPSVASNNMRTTHVEKHAFTDSISYDFPTESPMSYLGSTDFDVHYAAKFEVNNTQGFTLTHISNYFVKQSESAWTFEILKGDTPTSQEVIATQMYYPSSLTGEMENITLDEPIFFEDGETFVIRVMAPEDVEFRIPVDYNVPSTIGKYFVTLDGGKNWEVMSSSTFFYYTYAIKLRAMDAYGQEWVDISPRNGALESGASADVEITTAMNRFETGSYEGYLYIGHNQPLVETVKVPTFIKYNAAPMFVGNTALEVNEGDSITWSLPMFDKEADSLFLASSENADDFDFEMSNDTLYVTMVPSYTMSGEYFPSFEIEDTLGAKRVIDFAVEVKDVKVAPIVVKDFEELQLNPQAETTISLEEYFETLDGEEMVYYVKNSDQYAAAWVNSTDLTVLASSVGDTELIIVAENESGLTVESNLKVSVVGAPLSIDMNELVGNIYPNPTKGKVFVQLPATFSTEATVVEVHNLIGQLMFSKVIRDAGNVVEVDLSDMPKGFYMIKLNNGNAQVSGKVLKD